MKRLAGSVLSVAVWAGGALAQDMRPVPRPDRAAPDATATAAAVAPVTAAAEAEAPVTVVVSSKSPVPRPAGLRLGREAGQEKPSARRGEWGEAEDVLDTSGKVMADIIEWQRLRAGKGSFDDYTSFLARNSDWPGLAHLHKRGEGAIGSSTDPARVLAYFAQSTPQTGAGARRLAEAHLARGDKAKAEAVLAAAWTGLELSAAEEKALLDRHGAVLKPYHEKRLDFLLWEGERAAAERMLPLVSDGWKKLAKARMGLQREAGGVDTLIAAVPKALAGDPGLAYERMVWAANKRRRDQAAEMILASSGSAESLGNPDAWAGWRAILARQAMREGDAKRAYALASSHHMSGGSDHNDLEWLAGYLALTYLDKPEVALEHFKTFRGEVNTPISLGRAGYWKGRALEAMGQAEAAKAAYAEGAKYQTSFYGLLAAEKAGVPMDRALTGLDPAGSWREAGFVDSSVFQAARLFYAQGHTWEAIRFLGHLAESLDEADLIRLGDYTLSLGDEFMAVKIGKQVAQEGIVAPRAYYPLRRMGSAALPVPEELALSIARRESEFHSAAVSHAGARGLMQLMPATARDMAKRIGVSYSKGRLTSDPEYNIALGSAYLAHLIEQFGANIVLVSVGYNAGPHRATTWMRDRGDPRDAAVDVVDWIEHIPFNETRNYVMRVAESLPVYRARLSGRVEPIRLSEELKAR